MLTTSIIPVGTIPNLTASFTSNPICLKNNGGNWSISTVFAGSLSGTYAIQVSLDENRYSVSPSAWTTVSSSILSGTQTIPQTWIAENVNVGWARAAYTPVTASIGGTITSCRACY